MSRHYHNQLSDVSAEGVIPFSDLWQCLTQDKIRTAMLRQHNGLAALLFTAWLRCDGSRWQ